MRRIDHDEEMEILYEKSFGIIPLRYFEDQWEIFLVLHKQSNHWGFPKGKPQQNELPLESAKRELKEETGLKVERLLSEEPISEEYVFVRGGRKIVKQVEYFPAIVSGAFLLQPEEIREGKWIQLNQAYFQLTFEEAKKICLTIEAFLDTLSL